MDAAKPKVFVPNAESVDVVEIEDSPRQEFEMLSPSSPGNGLPKTPEPKEVDPTKSPESTEKARDASARRALRFPKLWWDDQGNVRIGKKLRYAPKFVKMIPSETDDQSIEWPQEPVTIGGRYFCRAIRVDSGDEAMEEPKPVEMEVDPNNEDEKFQPVKADGYETLDVEEEMEEGKWRKNWKNVL